MANPQHIEWLKEGVEAWNARRQSDDFVPDLSRVNIFEELTGIQDDYLLADPFDLSGIDLRQSNLRSSLWVNVILHYADFSGSNLRNSRFLIADISYANFHKADLENVEHSTTRAHQTNFQNANLTFVTLGTWNWTDIDLRGSTLDGTVFPQTYRNGWDVRGTDLSKAKYLDKRYYEGLLGDANTILPSRLPMPASWLSPSTEPQDTALPALPASPIGHTVGSDANTLSLDVPQLAPPKLGEIDQQTLEGLFEDLQDAVDDLQNFGNLDNQAPMLSKGVERFLKRLPTSINQLDQIRFGTGVQALSLQFTREKPILEDIAPEKLGHLEAALLRASLISANLPLWQEFRQAEAETEPVFEAKREDIEAIFEHAADALESDPDHFDPSLFQRIREYLDDATMVGYLASKDLLLSIAHKTFVLARDLSKDTISEGRKLIIKGIAGALLAHLAGPLLQLAGLLPGELAWLAHWITYLPKIL